jgi:predicted transposase YdaD
VEISAYTKEQLFTYDKFKDGILTERSVMSDARQEGEILGMQKGEILGMKKGEALGMKKGEAIGLEKSRKEFALACLKKRLPLKDIEELTGLTADEIKKIN